jgi:hypothetical protein
MVNFSLNLASIVGIAIAIGGALLYAVRSWRPELSRDYDLFFAAVALLCGGILFFYGWRFDPIMQFGQILLGGSAIFFAYENVRLRGVTTAQAKRQAPIVDEDRPVSRVYRVDAELDEIEPYDEGPVRRRIKGSQDPRNSRSTYYDDDVRRRPPTRRPSSSSAADSRTRRRRPRSPEPPNNGYYDDMDASVESEDPNSSDIPRASTRRTSTTSRTRRRPRPTDDVGPERPPRRPPQPQDEPSPSEYVDYQPIDPNEDEEEDNTGNFDY